MEKKLGKRIDENHAQCQLAFGMMIGISISVSLLGCVVSSDVSCRPFPIPFASHHRVSLLVDKGCVVPPLVAQRVCILSCHWWSLARCQSHPMCAYACGHVCRCTTLPSPET
jgi:hypothetical protein